jgi:hypothetical protein
MSDRVDSGQPERQPGSSASADSGVPSWPSVIATTVRLWAGRRLGHAPGNRTAARRRAGVFGLAIVVFAAGALTIALAEDGDQHAALRADSSQTRAVSERHAPDPVKLSTAALKAAAHNRQEAAAWVADQVSHAAIVSCDPVMCAALTAAGFPAGDLLTLGPSATDPMGSQVVVSTTVLRNQFGSRLPDVYAPTVLANFGSGASRVAVCVEAPDGARAYLVAQRADLLARQQAGHELLGNPALETTKPARQALAAGGVDSRLLEILAALTTEGRFAFVYGFGDGGPGASPAVPMRMMRIGALIPHKHPSRDTYLRNVLKFLGAQQPPLQPTYSVLHLAGSKTEIQIEFAAPSPLGLLGAHTTSFLQLKHLNRHGTTGR